MQLLRADGSEEDLIAACLFEASDLPEEELREAAARLEPDERARLIADLTGTRANRRHKPGRGFEALRYRFEIVSDYGAFRDLQRHRLLTAQWQRLGCDLGADVPEEVEAAGYGDAYREGLEVSRAEHDRLRAEGLVDEASYAVSLAYRIRYVLDMNAREAMHLIELRSGREGHPTYRAVALEMLDAIAAGASHCCGCDDLRGPRDRGAARAPPGRDAPAPPVTGCGPHVVGSVSRSVLGRRGATPQRL